MRATLLRALSFLFFIAAQPAWASSGSFFAAMDVEEGCRADKKAYGHGFCLGYLAGVVDTVLSIDQAQGRQTICLPDSIKLSQLGQDFLNFIEANPEAMEEDAEDIVIEMLESKYRC